MSVEVDLPVDADVSAASACCSVQFLRESGGQSTYVTPLRVRACAIGGAEAARAVGESEQSRANSMDERSVRKMRYF